MKYVIIIPDGCADESIPVLGGKTALQAANIPNMDFIARAGIIGRSINTPNSQPAGSDVATMNLFGYNSLEYYTGRAPLEAVAMGVTLGPDDWAVRCNLVTVLNGIMKSFTAGQITSPEAADLIKMLQVILGNKQIEFYPGVSYRNLIVWRASLEHPVSLGDFTRTFPPHDYSDRSILNVYPAGPGSAELVEVMSRAHTLLAEHPVNRSRIASGYLPATDIWLWGQGRRPCLPDFMSRYGKKGVMVTAVNLLRGLAAILGWKWIDVPGATGFSDTNFSGKGLAAIKALDDADLVCVHIEATDEAGHDGSPKTKVYSLEQIDRYIVGPVHEALKKHGEYRILVTPDHPTPVRTKTHSYDPVPWIICGNGIQPDANSVYDELSAEHGSLFFPRGCELMDFFLYGTI